MRKVIFSFIGFLLCLFISGCSKNSDMQEYTKTIFAMDTVMDLKLYSDNGGNALEEAEKEILRIEKLFDRGNKDSEIYKINQNKIAEVSSDTAEVISEAIAISQKTNGAFDITIAPVMDLWGFFGGEFKVPSDDELKFALSKVRYENVQIKDNRILISENTTIDIGGIGKGYASDKVAELLKRNDVKSAIISLGGNVYALGKKPDNSLWTVGIADPNSPAQPVGKLRIADKAVVTSGGYQRYFERDGVTYHHIIDPKTGKSADNGLASVTIISDSGTNADGLSTSLFVMGLEKSIEFWRRNKNFEAVFVDSQGAVYITSGIKGAFESEHEYTVFDQD